jgi:tetratricopeptide (TPR) repeat protein
MVGLTLETIGEDPGAWLRLMGRKVLELLNGIEIPRNANLYADRQYSAVLSTLLWDALVAFPSGVIIPLGVLGLYLDRRQWRRRFLLSAFLLPRAGFLLAFFTAARLRLPLIPLLTIFATYAACELFRRTQKGEFREIRGTIALLALLVLIGNAPIAPARAAHGAYEFFVLGNQVRDQVGVEAALPHYRRAVAVDPDSPGANFLLGLALTQLNRPEEANGYLGHAAQLDAGFVEPRVRLGQNLNRLGRTEQAIGHLQDALAIDPNNLRVQTMLEKLGFAAEKAL